MKLSAVRLSALLALATGISSQAATFTIGAQAAANPPGGTFVNVWPSNGNENPGNAIDGASNTKYLNFARNGTGYIYTSSTGGETVTGINFVTANDAVERDPASYLLYGSNSTTANATPGTVYDVNADFTLISTGLLTLSGDRASASSTSFANATSYSTYLLVFDVKGPGGNSMQIAEARLQTAAGALNNNGVIAGGLLVPEPGGAMLLGLLGLGAAARRRR